MTLLGTSVVWHKFIYVDQIANTVVFLMNKYNAKDIREFVNIGTGEDLTIKDLADII